MVSLMTGKPTEATREARREQAAQVTMLEEMVLQAQEREKVMEARMQKEIRK
jgi:hypothetical protein